MRSAKTAPVLLGLLTLTLPLSGCMSVASTLTDPKPYGGVREGVSTAAKNPSVFWISFEALDLAPSFAVDTLLFPFTVSTLFLPMDHRTHSLGLGNLHG